ncbi:hypothetical protein [Bradyrhizobium sp. 23]|uniref:hypothetical protein n=1 Tax=Bradyrhizobium sp. 23 TaxID=2782667 RepID=UPI001FF9B352|nr:hypothetical protein [Bradyrhizobium sp. 23]MCK1313384.1 hypothetical protein [Bradyrhizobium sp. 23]
MDRKLRPLVARQAERLALAIGIIASATLIGKMLWLSRYGLDLTDESLDIAWIARPWDYPISISQFGFIYHPIYWLMGEDIPRLRQANILITVLLAWLLCLSVVKSIKTDDGSSWLDCRKANIGIMFILATGSLGFLQTWIPTPNYNTLGLQALFIAGIGVMIADAAFSRASMGGWILIGTGGWLAFMAKPTTAAALGFVIVLYLLASQKWNWRFLLLSTTWAIVLGLVTIWMIDGSIVDFIEHYKTGLADSARLGAGHTIDRIFRADSFSIGPSEQAWISILSIVVAFSTYLIRSPRDTSRTFGACILIAVGAGCVSMVFGFASPRFHSSPFQAMLFWCTFLGGLAGAAVAERGQLIHLFARDRWSSAVYFVAMPHVYAFGTGGNYWIAGGEAGVFWVLTSAILFGIRNQRTAWRSLLPIAVTSLIVTTMLIDVGIQHPYRQIQSLYDFTGTLRFARSGGELRVSAQSANYIGQLDRMAKESGFKIGDPMIDLTGQNPGALYAIGAKAIGAPWLIGGYPGSNDWTAALLSRVPCDELGRAWVLTEPDGHRHLSVDVLLDYGIDISRDYVEVGVVDSTTGSVSASYRQHLLKPKRAPDIAAAACKSLR